MTAQTETIVRMHGIYTVEVMGVSHQGDGVARLGNFVIFVQGAIPGERLKVKIVKIKKSFAYAEILEVINASDSRQEPNCSVHGQCGGCCLQHMNYQAQLRFKTQIVKDNLLRIGGIKDVNVSDALGMETPWAYRNKAQFQFAGNGHLLGGFYGDNSYEVADIDSCAIQHPQNNEVFREAKALIERYNISVYNRKTKQGLLRQLVVKTGFVSGESMAVFIVNGPSLPHAQEITQQLQQKIPMLVSIILNINTKKDGSTFGNRSIVLAGKEKIDDFLGGLKFSISAESFYQVNPVQTEVLYNKAIEFAALTGKETVIDAYCGIGTISLLMARKARKVYGIEVVAKAVSDAKDNAKTNGIHNAEFIAGEAERIIPGLSDKGVRADVVVVDPPRKGCDERLLKSITDMAPERIIYISCNPSTLARDLKYLSQHNYTIKEVQPVDMFPHTNHVESIVLMTNSGLKGK